MNILYLHGLDGSLSDEKRIILENYGTVYSPHLKYRENPKCVDYVLTKYKSERFNVVIGSSMGGFMGYHIANKLKLPALLFNPALAYRSVPQETPLYVNDESNFKSLVLGARDEVIRPVATLDFISHQLDSTTSFNIKIRQDLEHRIPVAIFEEEVTTFFKLNMI